MDVTVCYQSNCKIIWRQVISIFISKAMKKWRNFDSIRKAIFYINIIELKTMALNTKLNYT